ncbi:MAG TPA: DUF6412 domain-containing protein [Trebonia sp.]|jgi:hypothetical protein
MLAAGQGLGYLQDYLLSHLLTVLFFLFWADDPQRAAMLTVAVLAAALIGCLEATAWCGRRGVAALPVSRQVAALRDKSWRVAFLRLRDPDARGRARPRAPSAAPAAA